MADLTLIKCAVEECANPERRGQRGWCSKHYERWRRHGDPNYSQWNATPEDRFWPKVDATGICWEWQATRNHLGYGQFSINRKHLMAHRVAWEFLIGPIPDGLELDHLCRNPPCVNPDHLEPVTHAENMRRAPWSAVQVKRAKTHCNHGHPLFGQNIRIDGAGHRICRACENANGRAKRQRQREARGDDLLVALDSLGTGVRRS